MGIVRHLIVAFVFLLPTVTSALANDRLVVVELFTSQGCSSCPPADALIGTLAKRNDVLPLSVHVPYWNYIGWSDPFALPQATERQRAYAKQFNLRYVYTPQMVVSGQAQMTGSDHEALLNAIRSIDTASQPSVLVRDDSTGQIEVALSFVDAIEPMDVMFVAFDHHQQTRVLRGENRNRTLDNYNVVRLMQTIDQWNGDAKVIKTGINIKELPGDQYGAFVQGQKSKTIFAAGTMKP
jgi:hypothetical protein